MACPVCGCRARLAFALPDRGVYACTERTCTLRFADPQPSEAQLNTYYECYYYGDDDPVFENSPELALRQLVVALERQVGPLGGLQILDFGCGVGRLARVMLAEGVRQVDAIESDPSARQLVSRELGICVAADVAELRGRSPGRTYDLVTMIDVVEHVRSPVETLIELRSLLRPGGTLVIETPDVGSLKAQLISAHWINYQNPTHLYYFSGRSLRRALHAAGFRSSRLWRPNVTYPAHGGARRALQTGLQRLGLDGALRVLATSGHDSDR